MVSVGVGRVLLATWGSPEFAHFLPYPPHCCLCRGWGCFREGSQDHQLSKMLTTWTSPEALIMAWTPHPPYPSRGLCL